MIFFDADERPELPELPELSAKFGVRVEVAKPVVEDTTRLEVTGSEVAWPLSVVGTVDTPMEVELVSRADVTVVGFVTRVVEDSRVEEAELDD